MSDAASAGLPLDDDEATRRVARVLHQTWCPLGTCDYGKTDRSVAEAAVQFARARAARAPDGPTHRWSTKCAYCGAPTGGGPPCCIECRHDPHAHCPSWPSCLRDDYGKPCDATRRHSP